MINPQMPFLVIPYTICCSVSHSWCSCKRCDL